MTTPMILARKSIAGAMALLLALGPLGPGAYAAQALLSDQPLASKVAAKPNLLYTLDDSGSMQLTYIPDSVITGPGQAVPNDKGPGYCRSTAGNATTSCGGTYVWGRDLPMFAPEFNRLYYNANISYEPPIDGAGNQATYAAPNGLPGTTIYKMMTSAITTGWMFVKTDPYLSAATTTLIPTVAVPVYCNTDWPTANPVTLLSVGNTYGEYSATAGQDCRINGTSYDALNGAPAVVDDYNYPYNWSTAGVNDPKYFYRNGQNRAIWCKTGAPGWPATTTATGCSTVCAVITPPVAQTCFYQSNATTTGAPYTYSPVGCETNPAYQWTWATGGCVGTIGVECLACSRTSTTTVTGKNGRCRLASSSAPGSGGSNAACNCAGAGCTLPACPTYDPPDTSCTTTCTGSTTTANGSAACNSQYGGTGGTAISPNRLVDDANGAGITCRHNNNTGSYVSTRFTYPESAVADPTKYNKFVSDSQCGNVAATVNIPRHYYSIASVQFCNLMNLTVNAQWKGFGIAGTCQTKNDLATTNNVKYGKFTRTGLVNDGRTFPYIDQLGNSGSRTYAEEMTNYANWVAYYRTRILAAKTTTSIAFNIVDNKFRAGFHVMNAVATNWLDTNDFVTGTGLQREQWYAKLFAVPITAGSKTPTLDALIRIGQLVENGSGLVTGLPAHTDPIPTIAGNPVTCTSNYHILFTDGFTDQITLPTVAGEVDGGTVPARGATVGGLPALPPDPGSSFPTRSLSGLNALVGVAWPNPYKDATTPTANSLADISLYYWMRDLRPAMLNDVPSSDGRVNKDLDWRKDPAWWQHVNFSALSYGADGLLDASNRAAVENAIAAGTKSWFTAPNYPAPPNDAIWPTTNRRATTADDLWHATVNARGKFAFAQTPLEVAYGLGSIISGIGNNPTARVGATFASRQLSATNNFIYVATIEPGWSGELKKVTIDTLTGAQGATRWSAGAKLDALLATPSPGTSPLLDSNNAWFASRRIVTRDVDAGSFSVIPFLYSSFTGTTQLNTLALNATRQQKMVAYLRGGATFGAGPTPQLIEGTAIGSFRERTGKLGNISDSKPVIVGPANKSYNDSDDYGYGAYKAAQSARALRIYVGANDGMFHVFNGEEDSGPNTGGSEMFAYIPSGVFTAAFDEGGRARKGIQALAYQDGGAPIFKHHFYANGSPKSADIDFANCGQNTSCTPDWRSIVVAGLGKGGRTYFAIDATNAAVASEAQAASRIMWEFALPNSSFSFGNPLIAKTRADGWVVVIASGYNQSSGDGKGHLYVLNARTGALLHTLDTTTTDSGSLANPSGLTKISGYVKDDSNQILEQIYGGDLNGRVWRWDVSDPVSANWQAKTVLFATLTDPSSAPQPVTTAPEIEIDINNGVDRFVFVGTGRLLDADDFVNPNPEQIQSMYAIRDGTLDTPTTTGLPINGRTSLAAASGIVGVVGAAPNGWRQDMAAGQRIVTDPVAEFNVVVFTGTVLQPDPCLIALPAYIYARDYVSGESLVYSGSTQVASYYSAEGAVGIEIVALYDSSNPAFPTLAIVGTKAPDGSVFPVKVKPKTFGGGHRLSWRILGD